MQRQVGIGNFLSSQAIDRFHSRGLQLCQFLERKESFYMGKEFSPQRNFSAHQHGRRIVAVYTNMATVTSCENYRYTTLETRRKLEPNYVPQWYLGSLLVTRRSAIGQLQSQKSLRKLPQPSCFLISKVVNNSYLVTHVWKFLESLGK